MLPDSLPRSLLAVAAACALALCACDDGGDEDRKDVLDEDILLDADTQAPDTQAPDTQVAPDTTQPPPDTTADLAEVDSGCTRDEDCSGATPRCLVERGECVQCLGPLDCNYESPICSAVNTCSGCQADAQCDLVVPGSTCVRQYGICQECLSDSDCTDPALPMCSLQRRCGECRSPFDCDDPAAPSCTDDRQSGAGVCTSHEVCAGDDVREAVSDDGPAGATDLTPLPGETTRTYTDPVLCAEPALQEADWYRVDVQDGDTLTLTVDWAGTADIDVSVFDVDGLLLGESWFADPERVVLTYLPAGPVYVALVRFDEDGPLTVAYTITAEIAPGACTASSDCADEYRNQVLRGHCDTERGACERIVGAGMLGEGEACDSPSDCASGLCTYGASRLRQFGFDASWFLGIYGSDAATRAVCTTGCESDDDCGDGLVCTTIFGNDNHCTLPCESRTQCPIDAYRPPEAGQSWYHLTCTNDGHCVE